MILVYCTFKHIYIILSDILKGCFRLTGLGAVQNIKNFQGKVMAPLTLSPEDGCGEWKGKGYKLLPIRFMGRTTYLPTNFP